MCKVSSGFGKRSTVRLALAGMTAALLAGCADSSRFIGDPLGNPFRSASSEPAAGVDREMAPPPPYRPVRTAEVQSQHLAPPPADLPSRHIASYETPAHTSPRLASTYAAPRTERTASISAPSGRGTWSASGGMNVIAANGETASVLAQRYNVPTEALLHENGFSSAAQIRPGTRVVIPVYNANGGGNSAPRVAVETPVRKPSDHSSRAKLLAKRDGADKTHWVKGAQPAAEMHGREKALTAVERVKAEKLAKADEARAAKKSAKMDIAGAKPSRKGQVDVAHAAAPAVVREQPTKMAKVEEAVKKPAVDPTPTASLPSAAAEKLAANGNPEFRWPAHGRIIQGFKTGGNDGINIAVPEGTQVKAAESGTVAYAGNEIKGFGNLVLIRHPNGYVTAYANNGDLSVKRGEQVKRGQTIATSGQSGNVASPQLHFEVRKGSTPVDPTRYLAGL